MDRRDQLEWERRYRGLASFGGFGSVLFLIASFVYLNSAIGRALRDDADVLVTVAAQSGTFTLAAVLQAIGTAVTALVFWYLYRAARFRRPQVPLAALVLGVLGPLATALAIVLAQLDLIDAAREFVGSGPRNNDRAREIAGAEPVLEGLSRGGRLALGFALVLIAINAMRAGLLSRFMGFLGGILGGLSVFANLIPNEVWAGALDPRFPLLFWFGAVGLLIAGRWPGGRGPAWETGTSEPWPSAREQALRRQEAAANSISGRQGAEADPPDEEPERRPGAQAAGQRPKRKRKGRRS